MCGSRAGAAHLMYGAESKEHVDEQHMAVSKHCESSNWRKEALLACFLEPKPASMLQTPSCRMRHSMATEAVLDRRSSVAKLES